MVGREKVVKFEGRLRSFWLQTERDCKICDAKAEKLPSGKFQCPEHGQLDYRQTKRVYFAYSKIESFEQDFDALLQKRVISQLLETVGVSWKLLLDRLKGPRAKAWFDEWKRIAEKVNTAINQHYIQPKRVEVFNAILHESGSLDVRSVSRTKVTPPHAGSPMEGEVFRGSRFTEADEKSFFEVTRGSFAGYVESREMWVETLVLHYKKKVGKDEIDIGIRAPLKKYGHAFHIWLRMDRVHFYPVAPYRDESTGETKWVYRVYHTPKWKENLQKRLNYLRNLERRAMAVTDAARNLKVEDGRKELLSVDVSPEDADEILVQWKGGTLWDFVSIIPDRKNMVALLKKHGILDEKEDSEGQTS